PPQMQTFPPAGEEAMRALEEAFGKDAVPAALCALLRTTSGAEGWLGPPRGSAYLVLYGPADIVRITREFRANLATVERLVVIASDGGKRLVALDLRTEPPQIVALAYASMDARAPLFR